MRNALIFVFACMVQTIGAQTPAPDASTALTMPRMLSLAPLPRAAGVRELLEEARELGLSLGIVSSSSRSWIDRNLRRLGLLDGWATTVCADGDHAGEHHGPAT